MNLSVVGIFGLTFLIYSIGFISGSKHRKIIGGSDTTIKHFPFLVSIRFNDEADCGGSIISDRHILTAAHCMFGKDDEDSLKNITIHTATSRTDNAGNVYKVLSSYSHPKFDMNNSAGGYPHDIAIITLASPIVFDKYEQKINLPSHDVQDHQVGYVVGWGMMSNSNEEPAKQLQKLRVALLPYEKCKPILKHKMNPEQVCSFGSAISGTCYGDSGGPLVSHGEVVGIVSYGDQYGYTGKCADNVPDVYTNVFAYKHFIESAMNK